MLDGDVSSGRMVDDGPIEFLIEVRKQSGTAILVHGAIHGGTEVVSGVGHIELLQDLLLIELIPTEFGSQQSVERAIIIVAPVILRREGGGGGEDVADPGDDGIGQMVVGGPQ
jgi:hypothetical protein